MGDILHFKLNIGMLFNDIWCTKIASGMNLNYISYFETANDM